MHILTQVKSVCEMCCSNASIVLVYMEEQPCNNGLRVTIGQGLSRRVAAYTVLAYRRFYHMHAFIKFCKLRKQNYVVSRLSVVCQWYVRDTRPLLAQLLT